MSTYSLAMVVEEQNGVWTILAPWLTEPVTGASWEEAYERAVRARR